MPKSCCSSGSPMARRPLACWTLWWTTAARSVISPSTGARTTWHTCKYSTARVPVHMGDFTQGREWLIKNVTIYQIRAKPGAALWTALWLINWFSQPFPATALRRRHNKTVRDRTSSSEIDYVIVIKNFINPKWHQNPISGSNVTAIWILPIGGVSSGRVCACSLRTQACLFYVETNISQKRNNDGKQRTCMYQSRFSKRSSWSFLGLSLVKLV